MSIMTLTALILLAVSFLAALVSSWVLLMPFFEDAEGATVGGDRRLLERSELLQRKERVFDALEELEQERLAEKLPQDLYETTKSELTQEAAVYLEQLDNAEREK